MKKQVIFIIFLVILLVLFGLWRHIIRNSMAVTSPKIKNATLTNTTPATTSTTANTHTPNPTAILQLSPPVDRAKERVTKKFYGTFVSPKSSPVSPERFTGYHTGLDFETFPEEQNIDVKINVICTGPLILKRMASGYGGVAVQKCTINNQAVTVIYGHIRLTSITTKINQNLNAGEQLGVLGTGYSSETDKERKHLHLAIYIGIGINIKGYVLDKNELSAWIDPKSMLGL